MAWKILSALTIICLGGAGYFAWENKDATKAEKRRLKAAEENLKATETRKTEMAEAAKQRAEQLVTVKKERDTTNEDAVKLAVTAEQKEQELQLAKTALEQKAAQVTAVQKQIDEVGDVETLIAQVDRLKKDKEAAEGEVARIIQQIENLKEAEKTVTAQVTTLREKEARGRRGIVEPEFTARIAEYFPQWNFVILNKGNSGGVFANADLEVKRGRDVIARLKVRNVEQNNSVAELVPGTLTSGNRIQAGDVVVAAAQQSAAQPAPAAAPAAGGAAPAAAPAAGAAPAVAPGAMGSDPFGTPAPAPAPGAAPMGSDPFGAPPAGAAPAPAPGAAPMGSDPFGAPPAGATPAPAPGAAPMGSDPFGAPPAGAPPAAGTPAAPAAGTGTPANPSTADPFAPAPKA